MLSIDTVILSFPCMGSMKFMLSIYINEACRLMCWEPQDKNMFLFSLHTVYSLLVLEYWEASGLLCGNLIKLIKFRKIYFNYSINQINTNYLTHFKPESFFYGKNCLFFSSAKQCRINAWHADWSYCIYKLIPVLYVLFIFSWVKSFVLCKKKKL